MVSSGSVIVIGVILIVIIAWFWLRPEKNDSEDSEASNEEPI